MISLKILATSIVSLYVIGVITALIYHFKDSLRRGKTNLWIILGTLLAGMLWIIGVWMLIS